MAPRRGFEHLFIFFINLWCFVGGGTKSIASERTMGRCQRMWRRLIQPLLISFKWNDPVQNIMLQLPSNKSTISANHNNILTREVTADEIIEALSSLPGPDGFRPSFYKYFWSTGVKDGVISTVL